MRTKLFLLALPLVFIMGCNGFSCNSTSTTTAPNWAVIAPVIQGVTSTGASLAFAQPSVATHKTEICAAVKPIADVLSNYNDPNATFDQLRVKLLAALDGVNIADPTIKQLVTSVVDDIISGSVACVNTYYANYVASDQGKVVLLVSQSVANGLNNACGNTVSAMALPAKPESFLFPPAK